MLKSDETAELLDRARRIETRLTRVAHALGVDTRSERGHFFREPDGSACVKLPSPRTSLKDVLDSVPVSWNGPVKLYVGGELIGELTRS